MRLIRLACEFSGNSANEFSQVTHCGSANPPISSKPRNRGNDGIGRKLMRRRSGQNGTIVIQSGWYRVRWRMDVEGQKQRINMTRKIAPVVFDREGNPKPASPHEIQRKAKGIGSNIPGRTQSIGSNEVVVGRRDVFQGASGDLFEDRRIPESGIPYATQFQSTLRSTSGSIPTRQFAR